MKKQIISLLLVLLCSGNIPLQAHRQSTDSVDTYRFVYDFTYPGRKGQITDCQYLDLQPGGASVCYSHHTAEQNKLRATMTNENALAVSMQMRTMPKGKAWQIFKNIPQTGQLTFTDKIVAHTFCYNEPIVPIDWTMRTEQKEICGYTCLKAEADYLGRHWTVWYSTDLPLSDGPWKLHGLPGLILEAYDADNYFHFSCIGMKSIKALPITPPKGKLIRCTHDEMEAEYRKMDSDRIAYIKQLMGDKLLSIKKTDGTDVQSMKVDAIYIERREGDAH